LEYGGFSIHPDVAIRREDRERLEKLCRYVGLGPVVEERLRAGRDAKYEYLKTPWRDGTTAVFASQAAGSTIRQGVGRDSTALDEGFEIVALVADTRELAVAELHIGGASALHTPPLQRPSADTEQLGHLRFVEETRQHGSSGWLPSRNVVAPADATP
jgi:hypothetical protein